MKRGPLLALGGSVVAIAWILASVHLIRSSEQGVVFRFGRPLPVPMPSGIHVAPFGIDRVVKVEVTKTYTMPIGFRLVDEIRGRAPSPEESQWLTGDTNILSVQAAIQYQIADPIAYLAAGHEAPEMLRRAAEAALTESLGAAAVDDALAAGRAVVLEQLRRKTQALLDSWAVGLRVISVTLRSLEPPSSVITAFQDVQNARSDRERLINEARGYANDVLPKARGEAQALLSGAAATRRSRVETATGEARRFESLRKESAATPGPLRHRLYLETVERILPRMLLYVVEGRGARIRLVQPGDDTPPPR